MDDVRLRTGKKKKEKKITAKMQTKLLFVFCVILAMIVGLIARIVYITNQDKYKKGALERWADKLAGERRWTDRDQAVSYAVRKIETKTEPGTKLLLSTTVKNGSVKMDALKDALIKQGYQVDCVFDAAHDPAFIDAVNNAEGVVFVEKHGKTLLGNTADELKLTESLNKPVHGFVVI